MGLLEKGRTRQNTCIALLALTLAPACGGSPAGDGTFADGEGVTRNRGADLESLAPAANVSAPVEAGVPAADEGDVGATDSMEAAGTVSTPAEVTPEAVAARKVLVQGVVTNLGPAMLDAAVDLGATAAPVGLGGEGTLDAAVEVVVSKLVEATGQLQALGKGVVSPDGSFEIELGEQAEGQLLVAQVLNAAGEVIGGALVTADASMPGRVAITAESSLEAAVLLAAGTMETGSACEKTEPPPVCAECVDEDGNPITGQDTSPTTLGLALDIVAHINADVASGLFAAVGAGLDLNGAVQTLASGFLTGRYTELQLLAELDVEVDAEVQAAAQIVALNGIMADVAAAADAGIDVDLDVTAEIALGPTATLLSSSDIEPGVAVQVQGAKDLALNGVLSGLDGQGDPSLEAAIEALLFAQAKASAAVSSTTLVEIVSDMLTQGGAEQSIIDTVQLLGEQAVVNIQAAAGVEALAEVEAELMAGLTGQNVPNPTGNPLIDLLAGTTVSAAGLIDAGLSAVAEFSGSADAVFLELIGVKLGVDLCIDVDAKARAEVAVEVLVGALLDLDAQLKALAAGNAPVSGNGTASVDLVAEVLAAAGVTLR